MSLSSPSRNTILPLRIQERLNDMYARATGFSGPQILDFFSRYDINIESYPSSGAPSRKAMFEDCLARFDRDKQLVIVNDLLDYEGPMKHGTPSQDDIDFVRTWLIDQGVVAKHNESPKPSGRHSAPRTIESAGHQSDPAEWDIFLSHASEDKEDFARPLAHALSRKGLRVWYDEFTLRVGDSLRRSIDRGLSRARYGVVIISPAFLNKDWPQKELDGLVAREISGRKVILPVWHNLDASFLRRHSPLLADRLATSSNKGLNQVVADLLEAISNSPDNSIDLTPPFEPTPQFKRKPQSAASQQKTALKQRITNSIGMEFVLIQAGSFMMGSRMSAGELSNRFREEQKWFECEKPPHTVNIEWPFYLQITPVTRRHWGRVMVSSSSKLKDCGEDCPIENACWEDAQRFVKNLNRIENTKDYRVPSEAEWEYACRAGSETEFSFGDDVTQLVEFAWYRDNSDGKLHPVGEKKPNAWGLYDMHGNVQEWVEDDWHADYEGAPADGWAWVDNPRNSFGVLRGGSWSDDAYFCRSATRSIFRQGDYDDFMGFRLAISVDLGF